MDMQMPDEHAEALADRLIDKLVRMFRDRSLALEPLGHSMRAELLA